MDTTQFEADYQQREYDIEHMRQQGVRLLAMLKRAIAQLEAHYGVSCLAVNDAAVCDAGCALISEIEGER